jgi:RNA polymerase sigma factor (TIGR02999 family)
MVKQQGELYLIARRELARHKRRATIDTVALINEAYLRASSSEHQWTNQSHFLASMTKVMRHVMVDYAREQNAQRRGGDWMQVTLSHLESLPGTDCPLDMIALDSAMTELGKHSPRMEKVVELKIFGGLSGQEIASALEISTATVTRELRLATAFLARALSR